MQQVMRIIRIVSMIRSLDLMRIKTRCKHQKIESANMCPDLPIPRPAPLKSGVIPGPNLGKPVYLFVWVMMTSLLLIDIAVLIRDLPPIIYKRCWLLWYVEIAVSNEGGAKLGSSVICLATAPNHGTKTKESERIPARKHRSLTVCLRVVQHPPWSQNRKNHHEPIQNRPICNHRPRLQSTPHPELVWSPWSYSRHHWWGDGPG